MFLMQKIKLFFKKIFKSKPKTSVYSIGNYLFLRNRNAIKCSFIEFQQLDKQAITSLIDSQKRAIAYESKIKLNNGCNCSLCHDEGFIEDKTCTNLEGDYDSIPCPRCNSGDGN